MTSPRKKLPPAQKLKINNNNASHCPSPSVAVTKGEKPSTFQHLRDELLQLKEEISSLKKSNNILVEEVSSLKLALAKTESKCAVQSKVNDALTMEIDRLEQYGRRNCIVIKGISPKVSDKNLENNVLKILSNDLELKESVVQDFDKTHRVGPMYKDRRGEQQQNVIVRFKSHSSRYTTYLKRKSCKNKSLRFTASLTDQRRKLLSSCIKKCNDNPHADFAFSNIHGDILVKLTVPFDGSYFHKIDKLENVDYILDELQNNNRGRIEVNA